MSMTDAIADMLTRIRNGQNSKLLSVSMPSTKMKCAILAVLQSEGYIKEYRVSQEAAKSFIEVDLKYSQDGKSVIREIHRVSKPGKRIYSSIDKLPSCYNNMGIHILSTSKGVISDRDASSYRVGGEIICRVF